VLLRQEGQHLAHDRRQPLHDLGLSGGEISFSFW
jgi:hypothetical protein